MTKEIIMFMPSIESGGVEKNFFIVSNYLSRHKKVSVITISNKFKNRFDKKIRFISLKLNFWDKLDRRIKYLIALFLLIREFFVKENKIVFCFQANIYAILICKIFSIKIIIRSNSAPSGWSNNFLKEKIFKIIIKYADKIMVNSIEFKKDLKKKFNVNSTCIYNPLNKKEIIEKSKLKIKKIFKKNVLKIINVGRITDQKDQITLLRALNKIDKKIKFQTIILGRGDLKEKLTAYVNNHNLKNKIKFKNFIQNPYPYIKEADLFILTSKYEGLPNVLLEALVLNKFIISTDCRTGPKEILLNGKGGDLFKVGDYEALSKIILRYNSNKKKSQKKIRIAKKYLDRFDFDLNLKKYLNLINSLS